MASLTSATVLGLERQRTAMTSNSRSPSECVMNELRELWS